MPKPAQAGLRFTFEKEGLEGFYHAGMFIAPTNISESFPQGFVSTVLLMSDSLAAEDRTVLYVCITGNSRAWIYDAYLIYPTNGRRRWSLERK